MTAQRRGALLFKLLALALSSALGLLFAEAGVRLVRPQSLGVWAMTRDQFVVHQANIEGFTTLQGKRFDTNSVGMRDAEHALEKPADTFRILILGDSFMEAMQVEWADSLPALLEQKLTKSLGRRIEVINQAVSGWGTDVQLGYLERYGLPYEPDLVLLAMTPHNDISDNATLLFHRESDSGIMEPVENTDRALLPFAAHKVREWLSGHSHLYQLAVGSLRAQRVQRVGRELDSHVFELLREDPSEEIRAGWRRTLALFDRMDSVSRAHDARLAVFIVPIVYQISDERLAEFVESHDATVDALDLLSPQRRMRAWGASRGVPIIDIQPRLREFAIRHQARPYDTGDGHWDEDGHRVAAEVVAERLEEWLGGGAHTAR